MSLTRIAILFSTILNAILFSGYLHAANYEDCARFFNNFDSSPQNQRGYRIADYGFMSKNRLRYAPFRIRPNGTIAPFHDTNKSCHQSSRTCTYTYSSPALEELEKINEKPQVNALISPENSNLKNVQVIVKRDHRGNIKEIFEGLPPNKNTQTPEKNYNSIKGVRTTFEIRNNTCVPIRSYEVYTREVEEGGRKTTKETEIPVFIAPLCRDIQQALAESKELLSCFDRALGNELNNIFMKYKDDFLGSREGTVPFFNDEELGQEVGKRLDIKSSEHGSPAIQALVGYYAPHVANPEGKLNPQEVQKRMQRLGASPIISSQKILSRCYYRGLEDFIHNNSLWPEEKQQSTVHPSGSVIPK